MREIFEENLERKVRTKRWKISQENLGTNPKEEFYILSVNVLFVGTGHTIQICTCRTVENFGT